MIWVADDAQSKRKKSELDSKGKMASLKVEAANASAHLADLKEEPGVLDTGLLSLYINVCVCVCVCVRACLYTWYIA